ncbi:MAG: VOC family protein [Planctomycetes bacterium]|nr:VOC family protein [Planctomycetota bacterium]
MPLATLQPLAIHHIAVTTADPIRCAQFYCDVLGFRQLPRPPFNFRGAWLYDPASQLQIHVIEHPHPARLEGPIDTITHHFALAVADLDEAERRLAAHGVEYLRQVNAGGYQQIFFRDPDGNHIEVGIYPPTVLPT